MPIFDCSKCGCAENTAMAPWFGLEEDATCTKCKTGDWHGEFPRFARVTCPECGPVAVIPVIFNHGKASSGVCPKCEYTLNF